MDLGELTSLIYELLVPLTKYCSTDIKVECEKLNLLKDVSDPSVIINKLRELVSLVNDWNIEKHPLKPYLSKYNVEHLNDIYKIIEADLDKMAETSESNIGELKMQLKKLFENFNDIVYVQAEHILTLDRKVNQLVKEVNQLVKEKTKMEKAKIIGDLLIPLSKEIHYYLDSLPNQPHQYDDSSIYNAFKQKAMNNQHRENEYKNYFEKPINEGTYEQYYSWLVNKAIMLNVPIDQLLAFLWMKKLRNFSCHSDMQDFFNDGRTSYKYSLLDLLKKHEVQDALEPDEFEALNKIYLIYFRQTIEEIQALEATANASA